MAINETIKFRLENNPSHEGKGIITDIRDNTIWVEVVERPVKEFSIGDELLITKDEVIE